MSGCKCGTAHHFSGRLPDGREARDKLQYLGAWAEFVRPFEDLGMTVRGYDPGVALTYQGASFELPALVASRLSDRLRYATKLEKRNMELEIQAMGTPSQGRKRGGKSSANHPT